MGTLQYIKDLMRKVKSVYTQESVTDDIVILYIYTQEGATDDILQLYFQKFILIQ